MRHSHIISMNVARHDWKMDGWFLILSCHRQWRYLRQWSISRTREDDRSRLGLSLVGQLDYVLSV